MTSYKVDEQSAREHWCRIEGNLAIPANPRESSFAHRSGSSRYSPRNRFVAHAARRGAIATLLIDLLTPEEEELDLQGTRRLRFDIDLLARRVELAAIGFLTYRLTERQNPGFLAPAHWRPRQLSRPLAIRSLSLP